MDEKTKSIINNIASALIDQNKAKVLVRPYKSASGYWFGGGNMAQDGAGRFYLAGRYRNFGDSRTGLAAGERGLELAIFKSDDPFGPFEKIKSFSTKDLSKKGSKVFSIEGVSLYICDNCVELFISTEKDEPYPSSINNYRKPGTGIWSIDCIKANSVAELDAEQIKPVISEDRPEFLHVKDPCVYKSHEGDTVMIYCTHPFTWSSSNSALAIRKKGESNFTKSRDVILNRGHVWDVAATRITDCLMLPGRKMFGNTPDISLLFYDGAECLRSHDQHASSVKRPRGYSCEEVGGLAFSSDNTLLNIVKRFSINAPLFVSPWGTGCSRYVSTLETESGIIATWQQSQEDGSQPLVVNQLSFDDMSLLPISKLNNNS